MTINTDYLYDNYSQFFFVDVEEADEEEDEEEYSEDEETEDITTSTLHSIACEAIGNYTAVVCIVQQSFLDLFLGLDLFHHYLTSVIKLFIFY